MHVAMAMPIWSRATRNPLAASFAASALIHLSLYATYLIVPDSFLAAKGVLSRVIAAITSPRSESEQRWAAELAQQKQILEELFRKQEIPLTFVEVDPALAASTPPKEAKYYSTHDTLAANPKPPKTESPQPKVEGTQTKLVRLQDNPRPQFQNPQPLQPVPPPAEPPKPDPPPPSPAQAKPESEPAKPLEKLADTTHERATEKPPDLKPPGGETRGDLVMAPPVEKPRPNPQPGAGSPLAANPLITEPGPPKKERPRTLAQAYAQNPALAGRAMQQEGGVKRVGRVVSVDAKASPFGTYDWLFIKAVEERWFQLIDAYREKGGVLRQGKVVLDFRLRYDGRITDLALAEATVDELLAVLCQRAVLDPAPYQRWPTEMRQMIGSDHREVRFTFYYD